MKASIRTALWLSTAYIVVLWFLIPALESRYFDHSSMIRFDPRVSKDYNCIFVEGYSAKSFSVLWLSPSLPLQYLRIRYTPNSDQQQYGILFVDPRTLAYEAHNCCASAPSHFSGKLDSPQPIFDWINSQPHSALSPSHTNDAREIYEAVCLLAPKDLSHFILPTNFTPQNFVIGHKFPFKSDRPKLSDVMPLLLCWLPVFSKMTGKSH